MRQCLRNELREMHDRDPSSRCSSAIWPPSSVQHRSAATTARLTDRIQQQAVVSVFVTDCQGLLRRRFRVASTLSPVPARGENDRNSALATGTPLWQEELHMWEAHLRARFRGIRYRTGWCCSGPPRRVSAGSGMLAGGLGLALTLAAGAPPTTPAPVTNF